MLKEETIKKYKEIYEFRKAGNTYDKIAAKFNIGKSSIKGILEKYEDYLKYMNLDETHIERFCEGDYKLCNPFRLNYEIHIKDVYDLVKLFNSHSCMINRLRHIGNKSLQCIYNKLYDAGYVNEIIDVKYYNNINFWKPIKINKFSKNILDNIEKHPSLISTLDPKNANEELILRCIEINPVCITYLNINYITPYICNIILLRYNEFKHLNKIEKCCKFFKTIIHINKSNIKELMQNNVIRIVDYISDNKDIDLIKSIFDNDIKVIEDNCIFINSEIQFYYDKSQNIIRDTNIINKSTFNITLNDLKNILNQ